MKLLSVAVPCYNSEAYMRHCIDTLLEGGDDVEILIVNDGSTKDNTAAIADEYAEKYPGICRAIHQENKGHGGAVNTGIANAKGLYFKVVDSDDWVDVDAYKKILSTLEDLAKHGKLIDVMLSNYVYEKEGAKRKKVMRYKKSFPEGEVFTWEDMHKLGTTHYVLMYSIIYRTEILREVNLQLPEHTFYVDNLYAYIPFVKVKSMYYLNVNFYRYYIGRADQSVNEEVMKGRIDQQIKVNNIMIDYIKNWKGLSRKQRAFMRHDLSIIMSVTSILCIRIGTPEALHKKKELWKKLKETDLMTYIRIRRGLLGFALNLPGRGGRKVSKMGYLAAQKLFGFN